MPTNQNVANHKRISLTFHGAFQQTFHVDDRRVHVVNCHARAGAIKTRAECDGRMLPLQTRFTRECWNVLHMLNEVVKIIIHDVYMQTNSAGSRS